LELLAGEAVAEAELLVPFALPGFDVEAEEADELAFAFTAANCA
jgi:hypothetical protein